MSTARIPTVVLGGTGYVAGELLRLIAGHPQFKLTAVMISVTLVAVWT